MIKTATAMVTAELWLNKPQASKMNKTTKFKSKFENIVAVKQESRVIV